MVMCSAKIKISLKLSFRCIMMKIKEDRDCVYFELSMIMLNKSKAIILFVCVSVYERAILDSGV